MHTTRGFALVVVLAFLVLITSLLVAFFSSVTTDYASSKSYAHGATTNQLADSVVQLAMGQIKAATSGGMSIAWASQPGMIRTFDSTGAPGQSFKLYSSDTMISPSVSLDTGADYLPDWGLTPSLFTDLNSPVTDRFGQINFPIIDGNGMTLLTADGTTALRPDTDGNGQPDIEGFEVASAKVQFDPAQPLSSKNTPVAMPVRWLYVLRDGSITAPAGASGNTAEWTGSDPARTPDKENPIVGRIAFWMDDETSKVNINTAGEGTFWDTPRWGGGAQIVNGASEFPPSNQYPDVLYALNQPAMFEFQRYPGHPAQVALSPIFSSLRAITDPAALAATMAGITPRLANGGSRGGTQRPAAAVDLNTSRRQTLYATVDELAFTTSKTGDKREDTPGAAGSALLDRKQFEAAKFFLTANSRAPEVNLFNKPRISIWPVHQDLETNNISPYTSAFDRLGAFCSSVKDSSGTTQRYYFQRKNSRSDTEDYTGISRNQQLYSYLQNLSATATPGFGGNFLAKYGNDRDQILTEIFDYIRCTNLCDPNLGGIPSTSMSSWYWMKSQYQYSPFQLTHDFWDAYTFCGQVMPIKIGNTMGFGRVPVISEVSLVFIATAEPSLTANPAAGTPDYYRALSNIPFVTTTPWPRAATASFGALYSGSNGNPTLPGNTPLAAGQRRIQIALVPELFLPSTNPFRCGPDLAIRVRGLENITIANATNIDGGTLFPMPANGFISKVGPHPTAYASGTKGGLLGFRPILFGHQTLSPYDPTRSPRRTNVYPCVSRAFTVNQASGVLNFNGADITIEVYQGLGARDDTPGANVSFVRYDPASPLLSAVVNDSRNLIQTIKVRFPRADYAQPTLAYESTAALSSRFSTFSSPQFDTLHFMTWNFATRIGDGMYCAPTSNAGVIVSQNDHPGNPSVPSRAHPNLINSFDTVQSVVVRHGDVRIPAASKDTPTSLFDVCAGGNSRMAHSLWDYGIPAPGCLDNGPRPNLPLNTDITSTGDWDTPATGYAGGTSTTSSGAVPEGAYINKPDEGDGIDFGKYQPYPPYYQYGSQTEAKAPIFYTPNRILPSPGMFGSLSSAVKRNLASGSNTGAWQTLLFRPQPNHPGYSTTAPDHLLLDLFWMPVVEPYAISDSFSTAGKINLNYQIVPFTHITRSTALACLLKNQKMAAVPSNSDARTNIFTTTNVRLAINPSENGGSLRQFKERFANHQIFRSASEICDIFLVPKTDTAGAAQNWRSDADAVNFWQRHNRTGDNVRERVYTDLYGRLTTKSNTFTVHYRVQALKKSPGSSASVWVENRDQVVSESRGSAVIERYIDVNERIPDFAGNPTASLDSCYKFRVLSTKKFAP